MEKEIIFCSQYRDITQEEWRSKACSVSSLWMALKYLKEDFILSPDELLNEAISIKAFSEAGFWLHDRICLLAHNHGLPAYNEEFKSIPFGQETIYAKDISDYGVEKIFNFLKNKEGLVISSVPKSFDNIDKPHSILLHNILEKEGERYFVYNDSEKLSKEEGQNLEVNLKEFKDKWRKLAIFINKI
jgi:hypothetical protein